MTALPEALFTSPLPGLDRPLTRPEGESIDNYLRILTKWQKIHRLVGSTDVAWMIENIIIDSFAFLEYLPSEARTVADVGSGAGVPGVPIAIVRPDLNMSLVEVRRHRVSFLSTAIRELELARVEVLAARVEDLGTTHRGRFDAVLMRCAGPPGSVLAPALDILRSGGVIVMSAKHGSVGGAGEAVSVHVQHGRRRSLRRVRKP